MCGIAGALSPGVADLSPAVAAMVAALRHRGPDDSGQEAMPTGAGELALGSTRLAIVDLSAAGHMPMRDPETGNLVAYNGEIYNFPELRRELEAAGDRFRSGTDTEVLLRAYARWGTGCLPRLRGMFAFALWDAGRRELLLARDPAGKKPLYLAERPGRVAFASEVRALLASGLVERRLDRAGLETFLFNGFCVAPATLVEGVSALLPGHFLRLSGTGERLELARYDPIDEARDAGAPRADAEAVLDTLREAVRLRLVADVPLGAFLSGGLDSAAVVALMAEASSAVRTFSIGFEESAYDESGPARWVAERFATRHSAIRLSRDDFMAWLDDGLAAFDLPSFDGLNTYCVSRAAREAGLTVALSGIGADELFGGYPFFRSIPRLRRMAGLLHALGPVLRTAVDRVARPGTDRLRGGWKVAELLRLGRPDDPVIACYQTAQMLFPGWSRTALLGGPERTRWGLPAAFLDLLSGELAGAGDPAAAVSLLASRLFLGERCLRDSDTMSMAVSLELRAPFTDRELVRLLRRVPGAERCAGAPDKPYEWRLLRPLLGDDFPLRGKQGFVFPFEQWLRAPGYRATLRDRLGDRRLVADCGLRPAVVEGLLDSFERQPGRVPWSRIWALHVLLDWCARHRVSA
ncbi:asparagine synthase (glutamine-hydrolysing) [Tistlia consotensis]|uniref:asparagine synthase (glutamine-hydrolyzing) n=1 Tax=Tistlia consotensis USBA 355 TaxID=560819 RepID=A0A1Y6BTU3_9PROT|nr:asparagine synthase (glutamine-hydrolyzing) [Tistlia consotensis]SMF21060.1 asparagine synthase (glutamine-hydrolysing) [Tistlia consotensis USBA 355]SNR47227.1 asparagine synthase (glutamine-hydrolysing) [Tistlia consotensis]